MKEEKEIPKTYYEKILVTSGEVPEVSGKFITNKGIVPYRKIHGFHEYDSSGNKMYPVSVEIDWWMKPTASPKQEIEQLIEDYKRKITQVQELKEKETTDIGRVRLVTKASDFRTFITELERVIADK